MRLEFTLFMLFCIGCVSSECPGGWTEYINSDKCVKAVGEQKTYFDALQYCKGQGNDGTLASVHNGFQNAQIASLGQTESLSCSYWIGLNSFENVDSSEFTDGTEVDYQNWMTGYPVKSEKGWAAFLALAKNQWESTDDLTEEKCFICEQNSKQEATTSRPLSPDAERCFYPEAVYFNHSCYYFSREAETFQEAETVCRHHFLAHLVSIHSQGEQDFINTHVANDMYWIGLYQKGVYYTFQWIDGTWTYPYSNWGDGYPKREDYVTCAETTNIDGGTWVNDDCNYGSLYICKFPEINGAPK